ncbi:hypothetical protein DFP73DRAFT_592182 [Morchella snyderi]|nr:hypothetical protein DFP73DRAFT_592182 [Morchella snyderi]
MTTTAADAAILAAQAAADDAFFRSLDLSENNKENLPPWLLEEREPVWERQRAYLAAWRPSPEQERCYRMRHPLPPQRDAAILDIHFSMASTLPIIRPRRVRNEWHEIFLQEWERPIIPNPNPHPWISSARRGNPVPQPFLNSPILDSRGNLIHHYLPATENEPSGIQEQMNTPRPESPSAAAPERWSRNLQRRAPIPLSFSTPQVSTPRISARNRPMSMMTLSQEDRVNEFEIFVDPEERENLAEEEYDLEDYEEEGTLRSFSMSIDAPESDQEGEAVEELAQRLSSIRIIVDGPADTGRDELTEAFASVPGMAPTVLAAIHRRPRSSTYPGNKDQYAFAPIEVITESAPNPVQMGLPKPGPITRSTPSLGQDTPATLVEGGDSPGPVISPLFRDFEEFKKSFPRRESGFLEAVQG